MSVQGRGSLKKLTLNERSHASKQLKASLANTQKVASAAGMKMANVVGGSQKVEVEGVEKKSIEPSIEGNNVEQELFCDLYEPPHRRALKASDRASSASAIMDLIGYTRPMTGSVSNPSSKGQDNGSSSSRDLAGNWRKSSSSPNNSAGSWADSSSGDAMESDEIDEKTEVGKKRRNRPRGRRGRRSGKNSQVDSGSGSDELAIELADKFADELSDEIANDKNPESPLNTMGLINAENAQSVLAPSACVFVANLPWQWSDEELVSAIQNVFRKFGNECWTNVRRDEHNNPFAFVQYVTDHEAIRAIYKGRGIKIGGRPIRTEQSKANRLYFVAKRSGLEISKDEALRALQPMGGIDEIWLPSQVETDAYHLPSGWFVKATYYSKARDALLTFNRDAMYRVVPMNCSPKSSKKVYVPTSRAPNRPQRPDDTRSIFVGNLPLGTNEIEVSEVFGAYGAIVSVHVCQRESKYAGAPDNCFAFVEFFQRQMIVKAVVEMDGNVFPGSGNILRVKMKANGASNGIELRAAPSRRPINSPATQFPENPKVHILNFVDDPAPPSGGNVNNANSNSFTPPSPAGGFNLGGSPYGVPTGGNMITTSYGVSAPVIGMMGHNSQQTQPFSHQIPYPMYNGTTAPFPAPIYPTPYAPNMYGYAAPPALPPSTPPSSGFPYGYGYTYGYSYNGGGEMNPSQGAAMYVGLDGHHYPYGPTGAFYGQGAPTNTTDVSNQGAFANGAQVPVQNSFANVSEAMPGPGTFINIAQVSGDRAAVNAAEASQITEVGQITNATGLGLQNLQGQVEALSLQNGNATGNVPTL